ncbi:dynein axonemal intermediate chain 4-like isoform X2 [Mercenaria mercenaria]|uniref:dynein axonemal intermediate chain 4-like isoform X2 n=1 Tax=Mercenaria mercenaria TaxID=6596 RepID=UPI00234F9447|nr:dynein axonemal intermediate chain 4-like isoform X2 [Mercenaria mercenaria]
MSTSRNKKSQHMLAPGNNVGASTTSKKSHGASTMKSKYGTIRGTTYGSSRTNIPSSASKARSLVNAQDGGKPHKAPVQIYDETGNDVTPQPLHLGDPNQAKQKQSNLLAESSGGTPTDLMSQASIYNTGTVTASTFGGGPFTRSVFSQSYDTGSESMAEPDETDQSQEISTAWGEIKHKRVDVEEDLQEEDLEKIVDLTLTETETIWLLDMPGVCVSTESDEADSVRKKNEAYQDLVKNKQGNDRYAERGMNTFNEPQKCKLVQTSKIGYSEMGVNATTWDMYDTYEEIEKNAKGKAAEDDEEGTISRPGSPKEGEEEAKPASTDTPDTVVREKSAASVRIAKAKVVEDSRATFTSSFAGSESIFASRETGVSSVPTEASAIDEDKIIQSESFKTDLFVMERVINLNTYQGKQALYRGFSIVKGSEPEEAVPDIDQDTSTAPQQLAVSDDVGPNFDRLWSYTCKGTQGRNVSCLSWNKSNPDLIAVGYGQFEFSNQKEGLLMCWSLKNPEFPERVYTCKEGVTAADFSRVNPSLLAVGLYDGSVAVFNVRQSADEPILDSFLSPGKHTAPVWQIKWIEKERGSGEESAEVLVSISTDGRVCQWSIRKGFECYDLMRLKKMPTRMGGKKEKKGEAFISRHAGGLSFDFNTRDANIYLAGTEDGHIHRCSCSYNEQFLESYFGHTGPVYGIVWSPFVPDVFLSCSADWSIRLWHQDKPRPILNFFSSTKPVYDIAWSPKSSTVFACVNEGAVEVWDLNISTLDPIIVNNPTSGAKQTSVTFSKNSDCLLVGDSEGQVTVLQLRSMPVPVSQDKQPDALLEVIRKSLATGGKTHTDLGHDLELEVDSKEDGKEGLNDSLKEINELIGDSSEMDS